MNANRFVGTTDGSLFLSKAPRPHRHHLQQLSAPSFLIVGLTENQSVLFRMIPELGRVLAALSCRNRPERAALSVCPKSGCLNNRNKGLDQSWSFAFMTSHPHPVPPARSAAAAARARAPNRSRPAAAAPGASRAPRYAPDPSPSHFSIEN